MAKKMYKIKRSHSIYNNYGRRRVFVRLASISVAVVLLAGLGWFLYTPAYNFIMALNKPRPASSSLSTPSSSQSPQSESTNQPIVISNIKSAYLPVEIAKDSGRLESFIASLKGSDINCVMIEMKDKDGLLNYKSKFAVASSAMSAGAVEAKAIADKLLAAGIKPIALINVFSDQTYAYSNRNAAVKYQSSDYLWLDNYEESGGKPWLNPYSDEARRYNINVAKELCDAGFSAIAAANVQFPSGYGQEQATYGTTTVTKNEILKQFMSELAQAISLVNAKCYQYLTAYDAIERPVSLYDGNAILCDHAMIDMMPSVLPPGYAPNGAPLVAPAKTPYESVSAVASKLKSLNPQLDILPILQAYTSDTIASDYNKTYTSEDVAAQISALSAQGMSQYMLYDPKGEYTIR